MHPSLLHAAEAAQTPLDFHVITFALLHALGMGLVLMAVTGYVDHKQEAKGPDPRANVQNASNVLFMCVAIATVIILVGNNVARAFALGAAIALIRFKMKLGESSSGSGLLFAILCGMASAIGLHSVGWVLAIGYSIVQLLLSFVIARLKPAIAPETQKAVEVENEAAAHSTAPTLAAESLPVEPAAERDAVPARAPGLPLPVLTRTKPAPERVKWM